MTADPADLASLHAIAEHLERGGLLGYPTETVYGLGAAATVEGVDAIGALKGRDRGKPFLVLVPTGQLPRSLAVESAARALADRFWPGPLTLVLPEEEARFPSGIRGPGGGVAVRISSDPWVTALLRIWRRPLISTSANRTGERTVRTAEGLRELLAGSPAGDRIWLVDGGPLDESLPSTVVDCTGPAPRLLRAGKISFEALTEVVPGLRKTEESR